MNILDHFTAGNHAPCLVSPAGTRSYAALALKLDAAARRLGPERRLVAIEAAPTEDFIVSYLAALRGGHAVALLPPGDAAAAHAFADDFAPSFTCSRRNGLWQMVKQAPPEGSSLHPGLAVMLATSGSEGKPRWVRLSYGNITANAASIVEFLGLTAADRVAHTLPFHYSYGLSVLHTHLAAGASLAFCGESVIEPGFRDTAAALGCTGLSGVPLTFELLERTGLRDRLWPALRYMTAAGGRLPPALAIRYHDALAAQGGALFVMYGQTEATARMAYVPPGLLARHPDCIGIAIPGGRLRIADDQGHSITAPGISGHLLYAGPNVMMGYATAKPDLARGPEVDELSTGDIASLTPDGLFRLEGRTRRFSKIAGLRIGHEAVEWALRERGIPAAVTGTDEALTLHVEQSADQAEALAAAVAASHLPAQRIAVAQHPEFPRLASGKIDYAALGHRPPPAATVEAEGILAAMRAAFYPRHVTPEDSFESLEGDSLAYVQLSLAIESRLGALPAGWEAMPAARLEQMAAAKAPPPRSRLAWLETHIVLRAAAILLIVVHHATLWPLPGGAAVLLMMVGYGFARFHREQLFTGRTGSFLLPMLRNLLPYAVVVAGFALAWGHVPWASLLFIGNLGFADPAQKTMLPFQFWFVEAYAQLCLLVAACFTIPAVRRGMRQRPFAVAMGLLFLAFALRYAVPAVYDIGLRKIFLLTYVLWFPVMGWCAFFATTRARKLALLAALVLLCPFAAYTGGNWMGAWVLYMLQFAAVALLVFIPALPLPRLAVPAVMLVSAASYHIYLFHRIVPEMLGLDGRGAAGMIGAIAVGLVCGIGAAALQKAIFARLGRRNRLFAPRSA